MKIFQTLAGAVSIALLTCFAYAAEIEKVGVVSFRVPGNAAVDRFAADEDVLDVHVGLSSFVRISDYGWRRLLGSRAPATASEFVESLKKNEVFQDFSVVAGPVQTVLAGRPAWKIVRKFKFGIPARRVPIREFYEEYIVVQRVWGYSVFEYSAFPQMAEIDRPKCKEVLDSVTFAPELPIGPLPTLLIVLAALSAAGIALLKRFRRPAQS